MSGNSCQSALLDGEIDTQAEKCKPIAEKQKKS